MPGFDGTGPAGRGPMTGWGRGYCVSPAHRARFWGFGGFGWGRGFGWRNRYYDTGVPGWAGFGYGRGFAPGWRYRYAPPLTAEEELETLKEDANIMEKDLEYIRQRIAELERNRTKSDSEEK